MLEQLADFVNSIINDFIGFIQSVWNAITNFVGTVVNFVMTVWNNIIGPVLGAVIEAVKSVTSIIINAAQTFLSSLITNFESTSDNNYQKSYNTINYIFDNEDVSSLSELPQYLGNYIMENKYYTSALNSVLGPLDTLNKMIPIDFSVLGPFQGVIEIINGVLSPFTIVDLISSTVTDVLLNSVFSTLISENFDNSFTVSIDEFNLQNINPISTSLISNQASISSLSTSISSNDNNNKFGSFSNELLTIPATKIKNNPQAKQTIAKSIAKPTSGMLKLMAVPESSNTNPIQTDSTPNNPANKMIIGIVNFLISRLIDITDTFLKKAIFNGYQDVVPSGFFKDGIGSAMWVIGEEEKATPLIFALFQVALGLMGYSLGDMITRYFGENYSFLHSGALGQLFLTLADLFGVVGELSSKLTDDQVEKGVAILTMLGSFAVLITSIFGITWSFSLPDIISFSVPNYNQIYFLYKAKHFLGIWLLGDLMNVLKLGIMLLKNAFQTIGKDLSNIPFPEIGYLTNKKLFILNSILDFSMLLGFVCL